MPLLERERPLAELIAAAGGLRNGNGVVVALAGEAGIGKTSLVNELARRVSRDLRTLRSGCEALFTPRPLGPFFDLALELGVDMDLPRERLFPSVLAALAARQTLLCIEDVHWADRATLDLLKYLGRRLERVPVMLLLTYRDDELGPDHPLITLLGQTPLRRIRLEPLTRAAVGELAHRSGRSAEGLYELTSGNAFYLTEVLAASGREVPATVRDAVLARLTPLAAAARAVVEKASLIPGRAELWLLDAPAEELDAAVQSGVVRIENEAVVFRHELARRAVESALSDVWRTPMHRAILQSLIARGERSLARLAHHAAGARDAASILRFAPLAATEAAKADAHREAAAHYRSALTWATTLAPASRADLLEALAYECYLTEQIAEALERRVEAFELRMKLGDERKAGDNLRWQSRLLWFLGRNRESRDRAREAIEMLEPIRPQGPELAMAYSNQSQLHMLSQEAGEAIRWGARAIELATEIGDDLILAHALNNVGVAEMQSARATDKLERSLRISLEQGFQEHAARAWTNLGSESVRLADYERGSRWLEEGIAWCRERDLDSWTLYMTAWRARLELETGQWQAAEESARQVLSHAGASAISRIPALAVAGRVRARRGDPGAREALDEARRLAQQTGEFQRLAPVAAARGEWAWLRDPADTETIRSEVADAFVMSESIDEPWARGELALLLWRAGALSEAPSGVAVPYALQIGGDWREAARQFESCGRPYEMALALADGDEPDALERAAAVLERLGDATSSETIRRTLRERGIRGVRASTRANPHGLTTREMEILALLDEGLRNGAIAERLSISVKTVGHHVSSILLKLGVETRGEAARAFRNQFGSEK